MTEWLTCFGSKSLEDKIDNYYNKTTEAEISREIETQKGKLFFSFSALPPEFPNADSRSLSSDSDLSSLPRSQGSTLSPVCHLYLCWSWLFWSLTVTCWKASFILSASLSDVHSLAGYGQPSSSCPEATLLAICVTSATQEQNYQFTQQNLDLQSIPCVPLCLQTWKCLSYSL